MSYSHNKYRQREYKQRDRQYQYHNYYPKKSRHDRDRYYDNRHNHKKALRYQQSHAPPHARSVYHPNHESQSHLQYYQSLDGYSHSQRSDGSHHGVYSNDSYDSRASHQSNSSYRDDWYSESVDDWRYDEGDDEDEYYVPPLSPLDLERKQYQLYIKKNTALHHIYLYQSDAKNSEAKTNSLDIRASEAKNVNNWNKYVEITNGIKQAFVNKNLEGINVLEIGCGSGNNLGIYKENADCIASYVGIDASCTCIESAMNKYNEMPFTVQFLCHNMFSVAAGDNPSIPSVCKGRFDLINIDLSSLHNAFKCKRTLVMFLRLISEWTHAKSLLMCSFVRDDVIMERFSTLSSKNSILNLMSSDENDNMLWQNRYQSISMKRMDFNAVRNVYNDLMNEDAMDELVGRPYVYYQMHSVDNIREYFICFDYLSKMLCKHCNMKLVYRHNASEIYSKYSNTFTDFNGRMVPQSSTWTKDERQVIDTYGYALFQRQ
eukprot:263272_1